MNSIRRILLVGLLLAGGSTSAVGFEAADRTAAGGLDAEPQPQRAAQQACVDVEILRSVLGETSYRSYGTRYLVSEIRFQNRCDRAVIVPVMDLRLSAGGQELSPEFQPTSLRSNSFESGRESFRFRDLEQPEQLELAPAEAKSTWVIFTGLSRTGRVPEMVLRVVAGDTRQDVRINDRHRRRLRLSVERIGPRGALGLITIAGELDTINVGELVEQVDRLSNQGVSRAVLSFADSAGPVSERLVDWLQQSANGQETSGSLDQFPTISPLMEELHVAAIPGREGEPLRRHNGRLHIHRTAAAAVEGALERLLKNFTSDEIVALIEGGHPLVRAAALACGGPQLSDEHLPMLLEFAASGDPLLERGAFLALSESAHPQAIDCLVHHAQSGSVRLATLAVESLAASRFQPAHVALEGLLSRTLSVSLADVTRILSQYPRMLWNDALRRIAVGEWREADAPIEEQVAVRREALIALGRIGHPQLVDALAQALRSDHEPLRATAFGLLVERTDSASERLAVAYALEKTRVTFPSREIRDLFARVRDPQAAPVLIQHLKAPHPERRHLIQTLAEVGDATIDETLAACYDDLKPDEQAALLAGLQQLGSRHVFPLAKRAIESDDRTLFGAAVTNLQLLDNPAAVAVLSDALFEVEASQTSQIHSLLRALEQIGTSDAYTALHRGLSAGDSHKEDQIRQRLFGFYQRSPGFPHLDEARTDSREEKWQDAEEAYSMALQLDPELLEAYSGRGHCRLYLDKTAEAGDDFRRALRSNPFDSQAVTGVSIALAREGDVQQALHIVQEAEGRFPHDWVFAYNAACVYGRAIETTRQDPESETRDARIAELEHQALASLRLAVERGFDQFEFMRADPDLTQLRELDEFQKLDTPLVESDDP